MKLISLVAGNRAAVGDKHECQSCRVFDPATGKPAGQIKLSENLDNPWSNIRVHDQYLVGSSGAHVLCVNRRTGELLWRVETTRPALSLAVGGDNVYCAELADPRRGEDESRDGSLFALNIKTGERVWQRAGGTRLRFSPALDLVVTPTGSHPGTDGEPVPRQAARSRPFHSLSVRCHCFAFSESPIRVSIQFSERSPRLAQPCWKSG